MGAQNCNQANCIDIQSCFEISDGSITHGIKKQQYHNMDEVGLSKEGVNQNFQFHQDHIYNDKVPLNIYDKVIR